MIRRTPLVCSIALLATVGAPAVGRGQDAVPGGWSQEVVHQSLGPVMGGPMGWGATAAYSPFGPYRPSLQSAPMGGQLATNPGEANGLGPLGNAIRRSTGTRSRRGR